MSCILPICSNPRLRENHDSAFALSMVEANDHFSEKWLLKTYLMLEYKELLTYNNPFFQWLDCFERIILLFCKSPSIINRMRQALEKGYYVHTSLNERYIPHRRANGSFDETHNILIYGYDDCDNFYTIAYNEEGRYTPELVSSQCLYDAIKNCNTFLVGQMSFLKVKKNYDFQKFSNVKLIKSLSNYLNSPNPKRGIQAYDNLFRETDGSMKTDFTLDVRSFRTLYEHTKIVSLCKNYLNCDENILKQLSEYEQLGKKIFYLVVKSHFSQIDKSSIRRIRAYMETFVHVERKVIETIIKQNQLPEKNNHDIQLTT